MGDLSDAERDAARVAQVLASINRQLARRTGEPDERRILRALVDEVGGAAERVLAYLHSLGGASARGPSDGSELECPSPYEPWQDWCAPRTHIGGGAGVPDTRGSRQWSGHGDPGE